MTPAHYRIFRCSYGLRGPVDELAVYLTSDTRVIVLIEGRGRREYATPACPVPPFT